MVWARGRRSSLSPMHSRQSVVATLASAIWLASLPVCLPDSHRRVTIRTLPRSPLSSCSFIILRRELVWPTPMAAWAGPGRNNYFVSDTNYGWGPNSIGDRTDITDWPEWFVGPRSREYLASPLSRKRSTLRVHANHGRSRRREPNHHVQVLLSQLEPGRAGRRISRRGEKDCPSPTPRRSTTSCSSTLPHGRTGCSSPSRLRRCRIAPMPRNARGSTPGS